MKHKVVLFLFWVIVFAHFSADACTIVAVSGRVTKDGRPLLLKNRDSGNSDIRIKISNGSKYVYLCQCVVPDGNALSGFNEVGFAIINSHSYNMPNTTASWNSYVMQHALECCATVDEFETFLDTLSKPIPVSSNYGVMDAQGNVAIFETNAYDYMRFNADDEELGFLVRTNHSLSMETTGISIGHPTSIPRYIISTRYLEWYFSTNGFISKEDLLGLTRCLINSEGEDLIDVAPFDENASYPVDFQYYIPRKSTTSAMVIQGVLPSEAPNMTVAWTTVGPPIVSVTVPYLITPRYVLPQKAQLGEDGHSWFCYMGQQLKNSCFIDNTTLDLAILYNLCETGVMQKISIIEEQILDRGNDLVDKLRFGEAHCYDIEQYYTWLNDYVEEQYEQYNLLGMNPNESINETQEGKGNIEYYDVLGRRVRNVREGAIIKRSGKVGIVLN